MFGVMKWYNDASADNLTILFNRIMLLVPDSFVVELPKLQALATKCYEYYLSVFYESWLDINSRDIDTSKGLPHDNVDMSELFKRF